MSVGRRGQFCACVGWLLLSVVVVATAAADTSTSLGNRSGEGGSPFSPLAQAPGANLFTGSLTSEIPIKVPPGRKSMTPQLALRYSSAGGASAFGRGWSFPIGRIERSTKWGVPRCSGDHTDDFVLTLPDGSSIELVADPPGSGYYRPLVEESYIRAELDQLSNRWIVRDRAGLRYEFGVHSASRVSTEIDGPILAQNPDGSCSLTAAWMLTRIEDVNGNHIDVEWVSSGQVPLPSRVLYGGNTNGIDHFYTVQFTYEPREPEDLLVTHRLGVEQRTSNRLRSIWVTTDIPAPDTFVRSYQFYYFWDGEIFTKLNGVIASDEPVQIFVYSEANAGHEAALTVSVPAEHEHLRTWNGSLEVQSSILDMNGDGKLDLVRGGFFPWTVHFGVNDGTDTFGFDPNPVSWTGDNGYSEGRIRNVWINSGPCDDNGWACTVVDTFDITGDGRTDYVVATDAGQPWRVHAGELDAGGNWGFSATPILWEAPDRIIRRSRNGHTYRDTIDVNGDGLPDLVDVDVTSGDWAVWLNHGLGFESDPLPYFPAPVGSVEYSTTGSDSSTLHMLTDFDGDGLIDLAEFAEGETDPRCTGFPWDPSLGSSINVHNCLLLYRNTGQGFAAAETMALPRWTNGLTVRDGGEVIADLVDVSGDGLPDWVGVVDDEWRVLLNLAGTLAAVSFAPAPPYDAYADRVWPGVSGEIRRTTGNRTEVDLVDLNGDGFLDRVEGGVGSWSVELNALQQPPGLLSMMENGLQGTNTIVYEPSSRFDHSGGDGQPDLPFVTWVVGATRLNDGLCIPPAGVDVFDPLANPCIDQGHEVITRFDYQDGRMSVDYELAGGVPVAVLDRGFLGFRRVARSDLAGNETVSIFGQGELTLGRLLELYYYAGNADSGDLVRYESNEWASRPATSGRDQVWLSRNTQQTFDLGGTAHILRSTNDQVDDFGNVLLTAVEGSQMAKVETFTTYATPFGSNDCFPYDKPSHSYTVADGTTLDDRRFYYDGAPHGTLSSGNLTRIETWLDSESTWVALENEYDSYGNLVVRRDGNGNASTVDYDDSYGTFLYPVSETNALGHASGKLYDYRYGLPAVAWGANGLTTATVFSYDRAGRLVCESRPGSTGCSVAITHDFADDPGLPSSVRIEIEQSGYATGRVTTTFVDALGRERYAELEAVVDGTPTTIRRDHAEYDSLGRIRERFYPYPASLPAPTNGSTTFDYHLNGSTRIDPLGRLHETVHSDGTSTRIEYYGERQVAYDEAGFRTERIVDAQQRVVREESYSASGFYGSTQTEYDGMGRPVAIYQNESTAPLKSFVYDTMGRRIAATDRDSGTWAFGYDHAGNLLYRDDPRADQHVQICYDAANRPTRRCGLPEDFTAIRPCQLVCNSDESRFTYDDPQVANSIGRLTGVVDEAGRLQVHAYDERGRQTRVEREIDADGSVTSAHFEYEYNLTDEVFRITYPDGEVVTTTFDEAGQPIGLQNDTGEVYVSSVWYDELGRASSIWHGNSVRDDRSYFGADGRHRLSSVTTVGASPNFLLSQIFQYDARGQISSIGDLDNGPMSNSAVYAYDHLGRLIDFDSVRDELDRSYQYDRWGNMTRKGDLDLSFGDPLIPSIAPHQINAVDGRPVTYDANGNRSTNGAGDHTYSYDWEDRLERIVISGGPQIDFLYDHEGVRRARLIDDGGGVEVTRYYNDLVQTTAEGDTLKSYFLGGVRVASQRSEDSGWQVAAAPGGNAWIRFASVWHGRPVLFLELAPPLQLATVAVSLLLLGLWLFAPGGRRRRVVGMRVRPAQAATLALVFTTAVLPWPLMVRPASALCGPPPAPSQVRHLHADHLGSTQVITNSAGAVVENIRYMPYGEVRGRWDGSGTALGEVSSGSVRFEYTGHERDVSSGLVYTGARFYDPLLGQFLTQDPAAEFANPYSYVGWDPINSNDPTGECEFLCLAIGAFVLGFIIGAAQAALDGADLGDSLLAGLLSGATSLAGSTLLGPVGEAIGAQGGWLEGAVEAVRTAAGGYGVYSTVESFRSEEYLAGTLGALRIVSAAFGGMQQSSGGIGAKPTVMSNSLMPTTTAVTEGGGGLRMSTLLDGFPAQPASGTVANVRTTSFTLFGIKVDIGTAWAIDSAGNRQVFDIFAIGLESEVLEVAITQGVQLTDAPGVSALAGNSTSIGGSGAPSVVGFGSEYNVGSNYSGVTVYGSAQYGIAPVGAYGLRETWTPVGE